MSAPLAGIRVLVPRGLVDGAPIAERVRELGGEPVCVPLLTAEAPTGEDAEAFAHAVTRWNAGQYDWAALTSARGAEAFVLAGALPHLGARIAAVGPVTAAVLRDAGFEVEVMPETFTGAALGDALVAVLDSQSGDAGASAWVLLPLSDIAAPTVERALLTAGHRPDRVTAYRTVALPATPVEDAALAATVDAVLVLSGSGARATLARFPGLSADVRFVAIGQPTATELERLGRSAPITATIHSGTGTVDALAASYLTHTTHPSQGVTA